MSEVIALLVPGLATEEGQQRIAAALEIRNHCDYMCYMVLRELLDHGVMDGAPFTKQDGDDENLAARADYWRKRRERYSDEFVWAAAAKENPNIEHLEDDGPPCG